MKKKRYFKAATVKTPCTEKWDDMVGNDQVRFCSHCAKDVNNLSAMTRRDALRLVRRTKGSICMRYIVDPRTNRPIFGDQLIQISRRAPRMAVGVMTASLSLSAMAYAQGGSSAKRAPEVAPPAVADAPEPPGKVTPEPETERSGVIRGLVTDEKGQVVSQVEIKLFGKEEDPLMTTLSDYDGTYKFEGLASGRYRVVISAENFTDFSVVLKITGTEEKIEDVELEPQQAVAGSGTYIIRKVDYPPLIAAVLSDEIEDVKTLLARGEDANVRDEDDGQTAIFTAVERGDLEMVKLLLQFGAKVDVEDDEKKTPLMLIEEETSVELVKLLLKNGAKVNAVAEDGDTALIKAARDAQPEILKVLIDAGAELDIQNKEGMSALMNAADADNRANVEFLVLAGANINLKDKDGDNAWDYTTEDEIEAFLIAHGVELDMGEAEDLDVDVKKWINGDYEEPAVDDEPEENEPISK